MGLKFLSTAILAIGLCGSVQAAADVCADPQDQATMNECADKDMKSADAKLNSEYKELEKRLSDDAATKKLIVTAQRSWVAFRDAECAFQSSGAADGSVYPMIYAQCITAVTNSRLADFKTYLSCEEGDLSCPVPSPD